MGSEKSSTVETTQGDCPAVGTVSGRQPLTKLVTRMKSAFKVKVLVFGQTFGAVADVNELFLILLHGQQKLYRHRSPFGKYV